VHVLAQRPFPADSGYPDGGQPVRHVAFAHVHDPGYWYHYHRALDAEAGAGLGTKSKHTITRPRTQRGLFC
jgi:hypothetical protein